ncbi:hypothetical protein PZ938_07825 [Luteipulveratus sp. YIM 133132]|uniref:Uncharacterized protein n=1 Tax=Luteipulveratus flavus TaxID=3031728 RepID=A0ABT6C9I8_9MICO|nr:MULTISPECIES: hypothetical protein [unclassified Luteipulveratus]MDE9365511.1 hypothetical protein [Luteipulveratus sp. YIM 133132]MDF8265574.1 hypothetical protein [Luteipulveratus sp. YIM 133296]
MGERTKKRKELRAQLKLLSHREIKAEVPLQEPDGHTKERGSFTYGYCTSCDWQGHGRRARDKARRDALEHRMTCKGVHEIRVATTDEKK